MNSRKNSKKAFTIVELVIVIAVIAILAAVLIPTFKSIINKANVSKDTQLIRNLNTAIATDTALNGKHDTMYDALQAAKAAGYEIEKINASATQNEILWDSVNDAFVYLNGDKIEYLPEQNFKKPDKAYKFFKIYDDDDTIPTPQTYSIYWAKSSAEDLPDKITVGFDAGECTEITAVNYIRTTGDPQEVVIRTLGGDLTVNAEKDTVSHYDFATGVNVVDVAVGTYNENGTVGRLVYGDDSGKISFAPTAVVYCYMNTSSDSNANANETTVQPGATVYTFVDSGTGNTDDMTENVYKGKTVTVENGKVTISKCANHNEDFDIIEIGEHKYIVCKCCGAFSKYDGAGQKQATTSDNDISTNTGAEVFNAVPVESVIMDVTAISLKVGETYQLTATVIPENATFNAVTWSTSNEEIATVDENGLVTIKGEVGQTVTITATSVNNTDKIATCTITISDCSHVWGEGTVTTEPTCDVAGVKTYTCTKCSATKTEAIQPLGHIWDEGEVTTNPTCTEAGVKTFTCTREGCGATKPEAITKLGHDFSGAFKDNGDGTTHSQKCSRCDAYGNITAHSGNPCACGHSVHVHTYTYTRDSALDKCRHTHTKSCDGCEDSGRYYCTDANNDDICDYCKESMIVEVYSIDDFAYPDQSYTWMRRNPGNTKYILMNDITCDDCIFFSSGTTLDLNGHTFTHNGSYWSVYSNVAKTVINFKDSCAANGGTAGTLVCKNFLFDLTKNELDVNVSDGVKFDATSFASALFRISNNTNKPVVKVSGADMAVGQLLLAQGSCDITFSKCKVTSSKDGIVQVIPQSKSNVMDIKFYNCELTSTAHSYSSGVIFVQNDDGNNTTSIVTVKDTKVSVGGGYAIATRQNIILDNATITGGTIYTFASAKVTYKNNTTVNGVVQANTEE